MPPAVPVIVSVNVPRVRPAVMAKVEVAPTAVGVTELGLKPAVAPDGTPLTLKVTGELKAPTEVAVTL